jgi:OOP family OmpA-OmpF porin
MKKFIFTTIAVMGLSSISAQTESKINAVENYNKWSVELAGGFNKPLRPMSSGYYTSTPNPYVLDLGARYMFNNKFGLKADFGYNSFKGNSGSLDFNTKYYRIDLQAVANLGRIMNFESWTSTLGLLAHTGFGIAQLKDQDSSLKDNMGNFIAGITGQIRLSNRFVLTGDFSGLVNAKQDLSFDASSTSGAKELDAILFTGTIGLTFNLGKNEKHADWILLVDKETLALKNRLSQLETMLLDTDKDGVADYLDLEPNTVPEVMVDSKGRAIDLNDNKVPDEIESYLLKNYAKASDVNDKSDLLKNNEYVKSLINGAYVATYFDFDKTTPTNSSVEGINFILTYLRNNPTNSIEIVGHADELGRTEYNDKLSTERANTIKALLEQAGVDPSRLNVIAAGEDTSVNKDSEDARRLVRRVTFGVK